MRERGREGDVRDGERAGVILKGDREEERRPQQWWGHKRR